MFSTSPTMLFLYCSTSNTTLASLAPVARSTSANSESRFLTGQLLTGTPHVGPPLQFLTQRVVDGLAYALQASCRCVSATMVVAGGSHALHPSAGALFCCGGGVIYSKAQEDLGAPPPREGGGGARLITEAIRIAFVLLFLAAPSPCHPQPRTAGDGELAAEQLGAGKQALRLASA
jgi:hypothetical protein